MREFIQDQRKVISSAALSHLASFVSVSSSSGDVAGAERMAGKIAALAPARATITRPPCSSKGYAPDLLITSRGTGCGRLLLLGHFDTVIPHHLHRDLCTYGDVLAGSGTYDMKGGILIALGVLHALTLRPELYDEVGLLVVGDEEKGRRLAHVGADWMRFDGCLCFEGGEHADKGPAVIVRRKLLSHLKVSATGLSAHPGTSRTAGRSALLALSKLALELDTHVSGAQEDLTITPVMMHAGDAINVLPGAGTLAFDIRAFRTNTVLALLDNLPASIDGVRFDYSAENLFPAFEAGRACEQCLLKAGAMLGHELAGVSRGGASDINFLSEAIPVCIDGLGPAGGGDHGPDEHVLASSFETQAGIALALSSAILMSGGRSAERPVEEADLIAAQTASLPQLPARARSRALSSASAPGSPRGRIRARTARRSSAATAR
ncbi:MAG: M20/M25/M40 family metallo-hydrolase [Solirubrobacteraceae bacterium]